MTQEKFQEYIQYEKDHYCTLTLGIVGIKDQWDEIMSDNSVAIYPVANDVVMNVDPWAYGVTLEELVDSCSESFFVTWQCKG